MEEIKENRDRRRDRRKGENGGRKGEIKIRERRDNVRESSEDEKYF